MARLKMPCSPQLSLIIMFLHFSKWGWFLAFMAYSLKQPVDAELVLKKSRFIARVETVENREQAQKIVEQLWQLHPDATHVCWALMAGGQSAAVDDGEPSGTAGRPMLEVLRHQDLHNVLATVVRYFGGVKLGAGGLVRAYTDAVAQALLKAEKEPIQDMVALEFAVGYAQEGVIRRLLQEAEAKNLEVQHSDVVWMSAHILAQQKEHLVQRINDATQGSVQWGKT